MNKIALIFISLVFGILFSGCSWITQAIDRNRSENKICEIFSNIDFAFIKNGGVVNGYTYKTLNNVKYDDILQPMFYDVTIINYDSGIVAWRDSDKTSEVYCPKLKILNTEKETKSFAVNDSGFNDFSVKVTKEVHNAQMIKESEIIKKDIIIPSYIPDKISIVKYQDYVYKADSLYIKKMRNVYEQHAKSFRRNLPCFDMNRKTYCDGDLVYVLGNDIMLRVVESGYGMVSYKLYLYVRGEPIAEASHTFMKYFQMSPPEVTGNHDLKKDEVPPARDLKLDDIKTFKAW